ncbi:MAG: hypothetical protein V1906_02630 [Candidatus Woesearchaeota archaeon]
MQKEMMIALISVLLAMVFALTAMMFDLYWISYSKRKKKALLARMQRKGLFGKTFIHPGLFFEYCLRKDKMDDGTTAFYKIMFVICFMLWFLFFLIGFVAFAVGR